MGKKKVVLYAQPEDEFPYVKKNALKQKEYKETEAIFGAIPFTNIGEEAWMAIKSTDRDSTIKLVRSGFKGIPWTVLFYSDNLKAVVTCEKYTAGRMPKNVFIELKVEGEEKVLKRFVRRLMGRLDRKPWKMTDWDDFEDETGKGMKSVIRSWKKFAEKEQTVKKKKLPEVVETEKELEYRQDVIVLKVVIRNMTSSTIKDLRVTIEADKDKLDAESWEQGAPRVNSTGTYTAMFRLRPKTVLKDEDILPVLRYNDGKKKKRKMKAVQVTVAPPEINGRSIKRSDLDTAINRFHKKEETSRFEPRPAADLFDDIIGDLGKSELYMLEPDVERRGGTYIGVVDLYGKDEHGVEYSLRIKVQGDTRESRVIRTLFSSDPEKIVGFKQFVDGLDVFGNLFEK